MAFGNAAFGDLPFGDLPSRAGPTEFETCVSTSALQTAIIGQGGVFSQYEIIPGTTAIPLPFKTTLRFRA